MNKNKMNHKFTNILFLFLLLSLGLSGCLDTGVNNNTLAFNGNSGFESEGGSSGTGNLDTGGGSSGTGVTTISQGVVTGFGSIYMNGIIFDTTDAIISIDGMPASESDLRVGMTGRITGVADLDSATGVASRIDILFNVKGPVDEIRPADNRLIVAGQTVLVNSLSVFENGAFETLRAGDYVEVSGLSDMSGGPVYAGYIRVAAQTATPIEIAGIVNTVDINNRTFRIGTQLVEYASAELSGLSEADIVDGLPVRVSGTRNAQATLIAERIINLTEAPLGEPNDTLIAEGIAESTIRLDLEKQSFFEISGITVFINTQTDGAEFINGTAADIGYGTRLKVFGQFISPGVINADRIEFYVPPNVTAVGNIESIDPASRQVSVAGLSMQLNNSTRMLDVSSAALQKFSIDDLAVGDQITAYILKTDTEVTALFLRRDALAGEGSLETGNIRLRGFANSANAPLFKLGSIDIDASASEGFFEPIRGAISAADFFAAIDGNSIVEADGEWNNSLLTASSLRFINLGNLTVLYTVNGSTATGSNDFFTVWDGTLNSEDDILNDTTRENMFISNRQLILGSEWRVHDIRVFGPGRYVFNGCSNNPNPATPCSEAIEMRVAEGQIGAHMLVDWGNEINIDVVNVWNRNQSFCPAAASGCSVYGLLTNPEWDLVSSDADGDGVPGIPLEDSNFSNDISVNFNLNF